MALETDTKESFFKLADRVAKDEIDLLIVMGGQAEKDDAGETVGIHASNIADGDGGQITHMLARFLEPFAKENPKGAVYIVASMLRNVINNRHGIEVDEDFVIKQLIDLIHDAKPTSH